MERLALESTQARLDSALETNRRLELEQGREQLEGKHGDVRQHRHYIFFTFFSISITTGL